MKIAPVAALIAIVGISAAAANPAPAPAPMQMTNEEMAKIIQMLPQPGAKLNPLGIGEFMSCVMGCFSTPMQLPTCIPGCFSKLTSP
ncbi:hypothetical protein GQ42DRAFT_21791 [Ramicandelaber brevisporus]|nr:hypothetical protein GQ42DRAFT_21791 [Ramicandelaber brevisporus]